MENLTDEEIKKILREKGLPDDKFAVVIARITAFILEYELEKKK